jgi:hypothetical protein
MGEVSSFVSVKASTTSQKTFCESRRLAGAKLTRLAEREVVPNLRGKRRLSSANNALKTFSSHG